MKFFPLLLLCGCSSFSSVQVSPDGTRTTISITTFWDSHSEVSKLRTTQTEKTQGVSLGAVAENSTSTNIVELLRVVGGILVNLPK